MTKDFDVIIDRFRHGDQDAFAWIYHKYCPELYGFVCRLVNDGDDAEDIVAEAMYKLYLCRSGFASENNIKAYLFVIARNACLNYLRQLRVREDHKKTYKALHKDSSEEGHSMREVQEWKEILLQRIEQAARALPHTQRIVFRLAYVDSLRIAEIAERLNMNITTVYSNLGNAREKIRAALSRNMHL